VVQGMKPGDTIETLEEKIEAQHLVPVRKQSLLLMAKETGELSYVGRKFAKRWFAY
jgi:hypothetical protein